MTIAIVQGSDGATVDNATSAPVSFSSDVTAGNLVIIGVIITSGSDNTIDSGDIGDSGTSTLGTWALDIQLSDGVGSPIAVGVFSAIVTGSGSLTCTVSNAPSGSYFVLGAIEASGSWDASRLEDSSSANGESAASTSGDCTSAGAALFVGVMGHYSTGTQTEDGAYTLVYEEENEAHMTGSIIYQNVGTGTTDAAQWSQADAQWCACQAVFKEGAAGGVSIPLMGANLGNSLFEGMIK